MSLLSDSAAILPILQTGSAGLAFLFGLMGLMIIRSHLSNSRSTDNSQILDIPPRVFNFMVIWILGTMIMFLVSCYIQMGAKTAKVNISITPAKYMTKENLVLSIRHGGEKVDLPIATNKNPPQPSDLIGLQLESNSQLDIDIEDITEKYRGLKKVIGENTDSRAKAQPQNNADLGASE